MQYGASINSFFMLLKLLIGVFIVLSVFAVIQMFIFAHYGGVSFLPSDVMTAYVKYSFGNMGFSKATCGVAPIEYIDLE